MGIQIAGVQDRMRALAIAFTLGAVSALPLSSLHTGVGVGHGHHFEQGVRDGEFHNVQSQHQLGGLHHVDLHHQGLHHDVGHPDRYVQRLSSRHYLDIGSGHYYGKRNTEEEEPPEQIQQVEETKADGAEDRAAHLGFGGYGLGLGYGLGPYGPYGLPYGLGYHGGYAGYGPYGIWKRSVDVGGSRSKRSPKPFYGLGYGLGYGGYGLGYGGLGGYGIGYGLYGHGLYGGHLWKRSSEDSPSKSIKTRAKRSPSPYYGFGLGPYYGFGYGGYGLGGLYGHGLYGGHFWKRSAEDSQQSKETRKKRSPSPYYGFGFGPYYGFGGYGLGGLYGGYGGLYGHGFWRRSVEEESETEEGDSKVKRSAEPFYGYHGYHDHHHHHHYPYHGYSYGW